MLFDLSHVNRCDSDNPLSRLGDRWRFIKLNYEVITNTNNCPAREPRRRQRSPLLSELAQLAAKTSFGGEIEHNLLRVNLSWQELQSRVQKLLFDEASNLPSSLQELIKFVSCLSFRILKLMTRKFSSSFITCCKFYIEKRLSSALSCLWKSRVFYLGWKFGFKKVPLNEGTAMFFSARRIFIYTPVIRHREDVNGRL